MNPLSTCSSIITSLVLTLALSACAPGMQPIAADKASSPASHNTASGGEASEPTSEWKSLSVAGAVNGGSFDQTQVVSIDKTAKQLVVRLPMMANPFLDGASLNIPIQAIPDASVGLDALPSGGSALALRLPLRYIVHGINFLNPARLPNGDPLPSIPDGELPSTAIQLSHSRNINASIYLAPTIVGIYVNTPFDPYIRLTLPIRDAARTRTFGYFTTVPAKPGTADGGFFISIALPDDIVRIIDDNL